MYHIGILKALEENDIPIDYIAGTSMGAIVAGLYASGYTPQEIEGIFTSDEMKSWLSGKIEEKYFYYFKRMPQNAAMITVDINQAKSFLLKKSETPANHSGKETDDITANAPVSLIQSTQLDLGFLEYFAPMTARCKQNFDSLFIPFRCVAVDASAKKQHVWRYGDLGMAIRSSMAIPVAFSPIHVDSMILFDGGLMNNFPWQAVEDDFAPDIIIGGKCVTGRPDLNSIIGQIESLMRTQTDYDFPSEKGLMISRSMDDVGLLDFKKASSTIQQGYLDAMARMPEIKSRVERRVGSSEIFLKRLRYRADLPALMIEGYDISGISSKQKNYVTRQINKSTGDGEENLLSFGQFKSELNKVLSESVVFCGFPQAVYNDSTGYFTIKTDMYAKQGLKVMLGGSISSSSLNQAFIGLQYDRIGKNRSTYVLNSYLGGYYNSAQTGARYMFNRYRPFYLDWYLTYNFFDFVKSNGQQLLFGNKNDGYSHLNEFFVSTSFANPAGRSSLVSVGASYGYNIFKYFQTNDFTKKDTPDRTTFPFFNTVIRYERNTLNYIMYPTRGIYHTLSGFFVWGTEKFRAGSLSNPALNRTDNRLWGGARFMRQEYFKWANWMAFGYHLEALYSDMPRMQNDYMNRMMSPAFSPIPLSRILYLKEFRAPFYAAAGVMPILELNERFYLKNEVFAFLPNPDHLKKAADRVRFMYSSALVYQTPVGPVSLGAAYFDVNDLKRWYGFFNIGFVLFNRRGIEY